MKNQPFRGLIPTAAQPFLAFLIVGGVIALFQCAPAFSRIISSREIMAAPGTPYCGSRDQIRNYQRTLALTLRGDVACTPNDGVPSLVTVTARAPLAPDVAMKRARFAWISLVQIREERLGKAKAPLCAVRLCDPYGKVIASVDHDPYPEFSRLPAGNSSPAGQATGRSERRS